MSSGRVVRPSPMAEGRAQLKQKSNNRSQRLRDTPAFPIFHECFRLWRHAELWQDGGSRTPQSLFDANGPIDALRVAT